MPLSLSLGDAAHSPLHDVHYSAGNRGAVYFSGDIVAMSELEERKKFRHNPLTGTFHSLPGYYDPLHRLSQFRNDDDYEQMSENDTDSVRSFVAVDLADGDDGTVSLDQPKSLSRMYSDTKFQSDLDRAVSAPRPRRFSDSDAETFFAGQQPLPLPQQSSKRDSLVESQPETDASSDRDESLERRSSITTSPSRSRSKTLPQTRLQVMVDVPVEEDAVAAKKRKSSSGSTNSTESESPSSPSPRTAHTRARPESRRTISSSELNEGFISTGKGVFRKVGLRPSNHERERLSDHGHNSRERRNSKPSSPGKAPKEQSVHWSMMSEDLDHECAEEYTQAAPRVPLNPFVARRLTDGDEIRIMAVHRHNAPRESVPLQPDNGGYDTDDEAGPLPKPYFIHENAVTEQYELCGADQLGDGAYAVVKPAIRRVNNKAVAIKQIHKRYLTTDTAKQAVEREIEIHLRLKHRNIVRLHEVYETADFLYLVMAKAKRGNLKQLMQRKRRVPEALAARLAQQIVRAVFFLHDSGVLHCDLKPENILLTDAKSTNQDSNDSSSPSSRRGSTSSLDPHADVKVCDLQVELCDFGLSVKVPDVRFYKLTGDVHKVPFTGLTGTSGYMAPELLQQQSYGKPVDMWGVGIVIYEMLMGYQPFYPPHACIDEEPDFNPRAWKDISAQAKNLVEGLLERDPSKRLTAAQALSHGWFDTATFAI
jgi:hypothetical protein